MTATRRTILAAMPALAAVAAVPALADDNPDAELLALFEEDRALRERVEEADRAGDREAESRLWREVLDVEKRMAEIVPSTPTGVAILLWIVWDHTAQWIEEREGPSYRTEQSALMVWRVLTAALRDPEAVRVLGGRARPFA